MTNENKKSIIEDAVSDLKKITEVADKKAMEKLVKEFPKKFEALLSEELNKVSNKSQIKKEPVKGKMKESVKDNVGKINESVLDMRGMSLGDVENEYDGTNPESSFEIATDDEGGNDNLELTINDIEEELANMENLANNMDKPDDEVEVNVDDSDIETSDTDPFEQLKSIFKQLGDMVQQMEDQKSDKENRDMFEAHMKESFGDNYESLGDDKTSELFELFKSNKGGTVNESEEDQPFKGKSDPSKEQGQSIDENDELDEMHTKVPRGATAPVDKGHKTNPAGINENNMEELKSQLIDFYNSVKNGTYQETSGKRSFISPDLVNQSATLNDFLNILGVSPSLNDGNGELSEGKDETVEIDIDVDGEKEEEDDKKEKEVDEAMGISISAGTIAPGKLGDHQGTHGRFRNQNENFHKRMNSLINENKKITKTGNTYKKTISRAETLVENYRTALEKYRNQLSEMAVFNTNLANVNNLLVNEELALTTEDKVKIINKFKTINSITESEKGYNDILTEMKGAKSTITENVAEKMSNSVGESSSKSKKIDEAIERTAYTNEHVAKIKKVIDYVEHGKRI